MAKPTQQNDTDTSAFIVVPIMLLILLGIFWMVAGPTLYYGAAKMAYWMLWPLDMIGSVHNYRMQIAVDVVQPPTVGLTMEWAGNAWRLPSLILGLIALNLARKAWKHPIGRETGGLRGKLTVDALMRYQAQIHSPIAPIVPIAKDMHKNADPRFHEPWHPHEVVEKFGLAKENGELDREKAERYLISQLGTRVFRPGIDKSDTIFADRLNDWEKAIFALLAPPAINGKAGLEEYKKLLDKLNYSAVNATQTPDLSLANEMYQKYREHPQLNNLWRSHHFSVTYLMQVYKLSKRAGKVTTADFLGWLRPNANGLYAALNSVGRQRTAFAECAGAHEHWEHEQKSQKLNRISVLPVVVAALQSLDDEYTFWRNANAGETAETMWGKMTREQARIDGDLFREHVVEMLKPHMPSVAKAGEDTEFDAVEAAARRDQQDHQMSNIMSGAKSAFKKDEEPQS